MKKSEKRQSNIEILRILLTLMVILLYFYLIFFGKLN